MFLLGIYLGVTYTVAIMSAQMDRHGESLDFYDILFLIAAPISVPILLLSSFIQNDF